MVYGLLGSSPGDVVLVLRLSGRMACGGSVTRARRVPHAVSGPDDDERKVPHQPRIHLTALSNHRVAGVDLSYQEDSVDVTSQQGGGYCEQGVGVWDEGLIQPQVSGESGGLFELSGTSGSPEENPL